MRKLFEAFVLVLCVLAFTTGCDKLGLDGGESKSDESEKGATSGESESSESGASKEKASEQLELADGEYYVVKSTGAIEDEIRGTGWGDSKQIFQSRGLWNQKDVWMLVFQGGSTPNKEAISRITLLILKGTEPGTYQVTGGARMEQDKSGLSEDQPVKLLSAELRFPDYQVLDGEDEVEGTFDIETISKKKMSGTADLTFKGEGGETANVAVAFDAPVVERESKK